jgi:hypothetical protein
VTQLVRHELNSFLLTPRKTVGTDEAELTRGWIRVEIFRFALDIRCLMKGSEGSGSFVAPKVQIAWLLQPAHALDLAFELYRARD